MHPDPDPSIYIIELQDANKKLILVKKFFCILLFEGTFTSFFTGKKKSPNSTNQGFSYYFCLMIEGSGAGTGSGSIPLTNGSVAGSRRPKNMWIRWIRIRIRIRNTVFCIFGANIFDAAQIYFRSVVSVTTEEGAEKIRDIFFYGHPFFLIHWVSLSTQSICW
jgi:hypothetical protein